MSTIVVDYFEHVTHGPLHGCRSLGFSPPILGKLRCYRHFLPWFKQWANVELTNWLCLFVCSFPQFFSAFKIKTLVIFSRLFWTLSRSVACVPDMRDAKNDFYQSHSDEVKGSFEVSCMVALKIVLCANWTNGSTDTQLSWATELYIIEQIDIACAQKCTRFETEVPSLWRIGCSTSFPYPSIS